MMIEAKYIGPTNYKGSRIKATCVETGESLTIGYNYALSGERNREQAAARLSEKLKLGGLWNYAGSNNTKGVAIYTNVCVPLWHVSRVKDVE